MEHEARGARDDDDSSAAEQPITSFSCFGLTALSDPLMHLLKPRPAADGSGDLVPDIVAILADHVGARLAEYDAEQLLQQREQTDYGVGGAGPPGPGRASAADASPMQTEPPPPPPRHFGATLAAKENFTAFHGMRPPAISVAKYLERIGKYSNCSPACFVAGAIYIARMMDADPTLRVSPLSVHRLLLTATMVAAKFLDDAYFNNEYWARVGGVGTAELNRLELELLLRTRFKLHITPPEFESFVFNTAAVHAPGDSPRAGAPRGCGGPRGRTQPESPAPAAAGLRVGLGVAPPPTPQTSSGGGGAPGEDGGSDGGTSGESR